VEIVAPDSLKAVEQVTGQAVAALAVFVGEVRLIDNISFGNCADVFVQAQG
jgi:pantothenate synthetase